MPETTDTSSTRPGRSQSTRERLLDAAVESLIELGVARTTTLEVQRRAGASRGALLHHFPSHAALLSATIEALVRRNDQAVRLALEGMAATADPLERAVRTLASMSSQPAFLAELELWTAARTDPELRLSIQEAERKALGERERVIGELFAPVADRPNYEAVADLNVVFIRGLALSSVLASNPGHQERTIRHWIWALETLLEIPSG